MRLLVADDDEAIQICMDEIARQESWQLFSARDGEEAMRLLRKETPDILVLDLRMPKMAGDEVLTELEKENIKIPVVLISAERELQPYARFQNVQEILTKPFDLARFVEVIDNVRAGA